MACWFMWWQSLLGFDTPQKLSTTTRRKLELQKVQLYDLPGQIILHNHSSCFGYIVANATANCKG